MTTEAVAVPLVRPEPPRRAWKTAPALLVATLIAVLGASTAEIGAGALWGVIAAIGVALGIRIAKLPTTNVDRLVLLAGLVSSTMLTVFVLPDAPEDVTVLLCVQFAGAWAPAGLASAVVLWRYGVQPTSAINTVFAWLLGGAFALPAAETIGVLVPTSSLRRGVEPVFGTGDYMAAGLFVAGIGLAFFFAAANGLPSLATSTTVVLFTFFAAAAVGFSIPRLIDNLLNIDLSLFWPPDFAWAIGETGTWWWPPSWEFGAPLRENPLVETFRIAVISAVLGCTMALPLSFAASTLTAPNRPVYLASKGFMNLIRTMPDLFWAVIFVAAVGAGPFAGVLAMFMFTLAIMSKLFSETIDDANPGPLEAAKATGAKHSPAVRTSVLPQVLPNYVAYALYVFELTIRASFVIGFVGAGGIGRVIEAQRVFFQWDRITAIVIVVVIFVFVLEQISVWLRRRLV